jgi:glycosyltransferase involved in cell wall biosynthesis
MDIAASVAACAAEAPGPLQRMLWVLPGFEVPFYGGVYTILRAADHLRRVHGVANTFAIMTRDSETVMSARIARAFPDLAKASRVIAITDQNVPPELGSFDGAACTLWTTAYPLLRRRNIRRKFYFLQDWEPLFYPAGTISSAVETTYRFGFHAICNTPTLAESYRAFDGTADFFFPAVDDSVFHARGRPPRRAEDPFVLVCYARPGTPRNCFESLLEALRLVKEQHGEKVELVTAGSGWDVAQFGLDGVVRNLGLLPYAETGALYRVADAGLVAMATQHPSYLPFELMACGAAVVTNRNPHTAWLLKDGENCLLCEISRSDIVRAVGRLINEPALRDALAARALSGIEARHRDWTVPLETIHRSIAKVCKDTVSPPAA